MISFGFRGRVEALSEGDGFAVLIKRFFNQHIPGSHLPTFDSQMAGFMGFFSGIAYR